MRRLNDDETVLLITFVQSRECLWNESNADFKRISITKRLWNEIGSQLNISGEEARSKWKNLRDKFKKLLHRQAEETPSAACGQVTMPQWKYYDAMLFVRDALMQNTNQLNQDQQSASGNNFNNTTTASGSADPEVIDEGYFQEYNFDFLLRRTPDKESPALGRGARKGNAGQQSNQKSLEGPKRKNFDEEPQEDGDKTNDQSSSAVQIQRRTSEDDYYFLMSLLPYIRDLNPIEKLELRSRMQNLVTDSYKKHDTIQNKRLKTNHH